MFGSLDSRILEKQKLPDSMLWKSDKGCLIYIVCLAKNVPRALCIESKVECLLPRSRGVSWLIFKLVRGGLAVTTSIPQQFCTPTDLRPCSSEKLVRDVRSESAHPHPIGPDRIVPRFQSPTAHHLRGFAAFKPAILLCVGGASRAKQGAFSTSLTS